ncbi:para-aminobenzoate synthetase/4-amino-4-deoxychorismate lyase [Neobacillus niacini]|uniref:aminodeoxychorismate synthase component I n=1 Tax=Neobacillus niacini TaxID=86668 RepID=UPI00285D9F85|nr:aminodeoxychorismate synthase component I [Neobacillus niacini]MDR7077453.1 para-aminobenzoate synthetase/4-amino-4-deoxychorismate lyase [Neobacillus niacini]
MQQNKPLLSFEFADANGKIKPFTFQNPIRVITAHKVEEVLPSFQLVQEAVEKGYYAAGYLSYESAPAFDSAYKVKSSSSMPLLWFGIFSEPVHEYIGSTKEFSLSEWKPSTSMDTYSQSITYIKQCIESGDTYQTNYTIRLHSHFNGDDLTFFNRLKKAQASNYCAYIHTGDHSILSASPELFFHLNHGKITTRPMKGTVKRGASHEEDKANANWLFHSEKNRAENIMIVDLLRNDLGMIAQSGTVNVEKIFEIEQYPTVHQMTSTISAKVSDTTNLVDIFKALFPCGSITGAPKISTMNIIADLENEPREVYCGTIGYITPNKEAIFNVPIRTVLIDHHSGEAVYGVGGGITWDSTSEGEYHEILAKARVLNEVPSDFQLLESLLLENGQYFLLEEHLNRLKNSAQYFGFHVNLDSFKKILNDFANKNNEGLFKVRLLLTKNGEGNIEGQLITPQEAAVKVILAEEPVDKNNPFLYHKTTNREIYTKFQNKKPSEAFDVLLWNQEGELTEFTNGNVVLEINGALWTPPLSSGLLAGTYRDKLIQTGEIHEKTLTHSDLKMAERIWFINSVRKWKEVHFMR